MKLNIEKISQEHFKQGYSHAKKSDADVLMQYRPIDDFRSLPDYIAGLGYVTGWNSFVAENILGKNRRRV